jgi:hypothetical protein
MPMNAMTTSPQLIATGVSVALNDDEPPLQIKLSNAVTELNIYCTPEETDAFSEVAHASWEQRASRQIGKCLGRKVFWCIAEDGKSINVLVSEDDDETWDIAVTYPASVLEMIISEIAKELADGAE